MSDRTAQPPKATDDWTRAGALFACAVFVLAAIALALTMNLASDTGPDRDWLPILFFFAYGLFTISVGYRGPSNHYYSFDRIAQVASVLVLGPIEAAWINGLASLIYPLHRLRQGVSRRNVLYASLTNSGIMTLSILAAGTLYLRVGGEVPLLLLTGTACVALLVLVFTMQVVNDSAMLGLSLLLGQGRNDAFSPFSYALELGAAAAAVLVALIYNRMELPAFILMLGVLGVGMLALRQFAVMRYRLVGIVDERTRSLLEKTLELERLATQDNLTGLFNRRYADAWISQQLELEARHPQQLTVAMADIDYFKQINDHHSHATGDAVLRRVATLLQQRCRASDMLARYGGEEFLFCFPATPLNEAQALCESLRKAVAAADWSDLGLRRGVTLSFGLASRRAGASLDTLLRQADTQLYAAKNAGRNRVVA